MSKLLVVIDVQNDFVTGSLGTKEAQKIIPNVVAKILNWDGDIIVTQDTHKEDYLETQEGRKLPILHCNYRSAGHFIQKDVMDALKVKGKTFVRYLEKSTFGSNDLVELAGLKEYERIEIIGLVTDICVISNAIMLKNTYSEVPVIVDAKCCAGTSPKMHDYALKVMESCQIEVVKG